MKERLFVPSDDGGSVSHCSLDTLVGTPHVTAAAFVIRAGQLVFAS